MAHPYEVWAEVRSIREALTGVSIPGYQSAGADIATLKNCVDRLAAVVEAMVTPDELKDGA